MIVAYAHEWAMVSAGSDSTFHQVFIVGPIYLFLTCWQFVGLATLADNYLCPTLENFCKQLKLSTGLAGATFLAFGSSAPELAIACASALSNKTELSIPTVLTSALIAFGLIPPVVVFSTGPLSLRVNGVLRDAFFYLVGLVLLVYFNTKESIGAAEAAELVAVYACHVLSFVVIPAVDDERDEDEEDGGGDDDEKADDDAPKSFTDILMAGLNAPFEMVFDATVPSAETAPVGGFFASLVWLGALSVGVLVTAEQIARAWDISAATAGMTLLAFGAQIPDTIAAVELAREGLPDAALSQAIASQVINISLGLGLPFLFYTLYTGLPTTTSNYRSILFLGVSVLLSVVVYIVCMLPTSCSNATVSFNKSRATLVAFVFAVVYFGSVVCSEEGIYLNTITSALKR